MRDRWLTGARSAGIFTSMAAIIIFATSNVYCGELLQKSETARDLAKTKFLNQSLIVKYPGREHCQLKSRSSFVPGGYGDKIYISLWLICSDSRAPLLHSLFFNPLSVTARNEGEICVISCAGGACIEEQTPKPYLEKNYVTDARWYDPSPDACVEHVNSYKAVLNAMKEEEKAELAKAKEQERSRLSALAAAAERKKAALEKCGSEPTLQGSPWFSSTYKVAAGDVGRAGNRYGFLCMTSIEYLSAAPNPFGGNAARIRVIGFDVIEFGPKTAIIDILY